MQIALSYSIHGAYWAYTKNQNVDEAQLLDVIAGLRARCARCTDRRLENTQIFTFCLWTFDEFLYYTYS